METALAGYAYLRRARRFGGPSPALLRAAAAEAGSDPFLAMTAKAGGVPVAAAAFARHGRAATYSVGWSDAAGRRGNAAALLLWHGLLELKRQGTDWLDLGGIDTRAAPGIARFKLGLGGNIVTLAGTFL
jgi:lipid II:glycine glycyltransferase (peptidoglycan interpeptide bridge formation enzyme)